MKSTSLSLAAVVVSCLATGAFAQTLTPAAAAAASAPAIPMVAPTVPAGAPNQIVHAPRLPTAAELSNAAAAQGMTIERIEQSDTVVTAVFKHANGTTNTVAYQLIPPPGTPSQQQVVVTAPAPEVVYRPAPRVIYYEDYPRYERYPYYWYPPVSVHLGISGRGHYHRGYRR